MGRAWRVRTKVRLEGGIEPRNQCTAFGARNVWHRPLGSSEARARSRASARKAESCRMRTARSRAYRSGKTVSSTGLQVPRARVMDSMGDGMGWASRASGSRTQSGCRRSLARSRARSAKSRTSSRPGRAESPGGGRARSMAVGAMPCPVRVRNPIASRARATRRATVFLSLPLRNGAMSMAGTWSTSAPLRHAGP